MFVLNMNKTIIIYLNIFQTKKTKYSQNKMLKFLRTNEKINSTWINLYLKHLSKNFLNSNKFDKFMSIFYLKSKLYLDLRRK